jgi:orotate phosphoribosyltransferase
VRSETDLPPRRRHAIPEDLLPIVRERTWARLLQASYLRGEFVLSSGRTSTHYIDKYRFETRPDLLRDVARLLACALPDETTKLAGPALGGVPLATAVALETGIPFVIVRPEPKSYATARLIEGQLEQGDRVVVIEDVVTTGAQAVRAARAVQDVGGRVLLVLAVVDRQEGGAAGVAAAGYPFQALYTLGDGRFPSK